MQKRTRRFLLVAAAILFIGLGTGLIAAYKGGFQNLVLIGRDGPDELAYVPTNVRMLAYADVRAIMRSDLRERLHQQSAGAGSGKFQQETGINLETDVDHVVAFVDNSDAADRRTPPLILARGRFDAVRIEGAVRKGGGAVETYKGTRVITGPDQQFAVAFVEPDLVAAGPAAAVHRAIDTRAAHAATIRDNADVMRMVRDNEGGTAWAVARVDAVTGTGRVPPEVARQLPAVNWFAVTAHVDDGVRGTVRAETRDEAAAKDLTEVIRGFMALARMQAGQRPEFASVLNSLELSGSGTTVTLSFAVPHDVLTAFASRPPQPRAQ